LIELGGDGMRLQDKVVVITGAGSGIGREGAKLFGAEGARLLLADVTPAVEDVAREVNDAGGTALVQLTDVSVESDVHDLIVRATAEFGRLDVLWNNAGIEGPAGWVAELPLDDWQRVLAVNLTGVFLGMKHALPVMVEQQAGSIISTASVAGLVGARGDAAYCTSKAGVVNLTRSAALEYARYGIRVNCICPGVIQTALIERITGGTEAAMDRLIPLHPIPRLGRPDDISPMALYLASDESTFVTGAAMVVDGGYLAR
jgi:NAD(P)-dependent dehydrogenase (short-subunit alcohol dehydrogenase family)